MLIHQIFLTIVHIGSITTYVISGAIRKPGYVLTIILFDNPPSAHTEGRIYVCLLVGILLLSLVKYEQKQNLQVRLEAAENSDESEDRNSIHAIDLS